MLAAVTACLAQTISISPVRDGHFGGYVVNIAMFEEAWAQRAAGGTSAGAGRGAGASVGSPGGGGTSGSSSGTPGSTGTSSSDGTSGGGGASGGGGTLDGGGASSGGGTPDSDDAPGGGGTPDSDGASSGGGTPDSDGASSGSGTPDSDETPGDDTTPDSDGTVDDTESSAGGPGKTDDEVDNGAGNGALDNPLDVLGSVLGELADALGGSSDDDAAPEGSNEETSGESNSGGRVQTSGVGVNNSRPAAEGDTGTIGGAEIDDGSDASTTEGAATNTNTNTVMTRTLTVTSVSAVTTTRLSATTSSGTSNVAVRASLARVEPVARVQTDVATRAPRTTAVASDPTNYSSDEVLAEDLAPEEAERAESLGFSVQGEDGGVTRLVVPSGMTVLDAAHLLQRELPESSFHLNRIYRIYQPAAKDSGDRKGKAEPDVPCGDDRCYAWQTIKWKDDLGKCAAKLKVGIIDTHVDTGHKALAGQRIVQETFLPEGRKRAETGHGTGVLAILAGRPDSGTPGLIPDADFFVASIFFTGGDGGVQTDTVSLLKALQWMERSDVKLVNMSFSGPQDPLLERRIGRLRAEGMVFTAAAGNEGLAAGPSYPAAYPDVIAVTAIDKKMRIYPSANRGDYIDLAAPGVHIWTALPKSKAAYLSGTSFAAPFVTAMLAIQRPEKLRLPTDDLLDQMQTVTLDTGGRSQTYGRGLLQAPGRCPDAPAIAADWTPVTEVSLR